MGRPCKIFININLQVFFSDPVCMLTPSACMFTYDFDVKVGIITNELLFLMELSMCKLRRITHTLNIKPNSVC